MDKLVAGSAYLPDAHMFMKLLLPFLISLLAFNVLLSSCTDGMKHSTVLSGPDSLEAQRLKAISRKLQYSDADSAITVLGGLRDICARNNNATGMMDYYQYVVTIHSFMKQDWVQGKRYADSAWALSQKKGNKQLQYKAHYTYGTYYMSQDKYLDATNHLTAAIKLQPGITDSVVLIAAEGILAEIYARQYNYDAAIRYYLPVLNHIRQGMDTQRIIVAYLDMCYYCTANKNKQARTYLFEAKRLAELVTDQSLNSFVYYNLGSYYFDRKVADSCIYYLNLSINAAKKRQNVFDRLDRPLTMLAAQYAALGNLKKAGQLFGEIDTTSIAGMKKEDSISYFRLVYLLAKNDRRCETAINALETVNTLISENEATATAQLLAGHERELDKVMAEKAMISKNAKIRQQQLYITFSILLSLLLAVTALFIYLYWRKKKMLETMTWEEHLREAKYKAEQQQAQQQADERNRIAQEMHDDLGASLTSVAMAVELIKLRPNDPGPIATIARHAHHLGQQINEIVWNLNLKNDNLQSLIDFISRFTRSFLQEAGIKCVWSDEHAMDNVVVQGHVRRAIYLVVKELINNIVKHAQASSVNVYFEYSNSMLRISVKDDGVGLKQDTSGRKQGNGLLNIRNSIEKLHGDIQWKNDHGTQVCITIPLETQPAT